MINKLCIRIDTQEVFFYKYIYITFIEHFMMNYESIALNFSYTAPNKETLHCFLITNIQVIHTVFTKK